MNIDQWLKQNDSRRYEQNEIKKAKNKTEQRRKQKEIGNKWTEDNDCPMGLKDNDGW